VKSNTCIVGNSIKFYKLLFVLAAAAAANNCLVLQVTAIGKKKRKAIAAEVFQ